jgi:hypothetical protein
MSSIDPNKNKELEGAADALSLNIEEPIKEYLPTLAPVSMPASGGISFAPSGPLNLKEIISFSSAYSRLLGQKRCTDGSSAILVTSEIEDLNILEVVRADRIVTQLLITEPEAPGPIEVCFAGTTFEGLRLAGRECHLTFNEALHRPRDPQADGRLSFETVREVGRIQRLLGEFKVGSEKDYQWVTERNRSMTSASPDSGGAYALASVVDSVRVAGGCRSYGHIVDIPSFGQIVLGEVLISQHSVQMVAIAAHFGCCPVRFECKLAIGGGSGTHGGGG